MLFTLLYRAISANISVWQGRKWAEFLGARPHIGFPKLVFLIQTAGGRDGGSGGVGRGGGWWGEGGGDAVRGRTREGKKLFVIGTFSAAAFKSPSRSYWKSLSGLVLIPQGGRLNPPHPCSPPFHFCLLANVGKVVVSLKLNSIHLSGFLSGQTLMGPIRIGKTGGVQCGWTSIVS